MASSPLASLVAILGAVLLLAPSLALLFGGIPSRAGAVAIAVAVPSTLLVATTEWMLLGTPVWSALYQGALASVAVASVLAVGIRSGRLFAYALFLAAWLVTVVVPVGFALFDSERGVIVIALGTLDFGGAATLAILPGTAAIALAITARPDAIAIEETIHPQRWVLALSAAAGLVGFTAAGVGAELVLDDTTLHLVVNESLAALSGVVGWTIAQVATNRQASVRGAVAGLVAGSVVVLPASPWLEPVSVIVLAAIAGIVGQLAAAAAHRAGAGPWARLIGALLVPALTGMIGAGVLANGPGLLFSGHPDMVQAQLSGSLVIVACGLLSTVVLALGARAVERVRSRR